MMWLMLQQEKPDDYVVATGRQYSIRQFIKLVSEKLNMKIKWIGKGVNEKGYDLKSKRNIIEIDENYIRPLDVNTLIGNAR